MQKTRGRCATSAVLLAIASIRACSDATRRSPRSGPPSATATVLMSSRMPANSLAGILDDISTVAVALGGPDRGERLVASLQARIEAIARRTADVAHRPRVFCMEWVDPPYCGGHWMKELVEIAGGDDALAVSHRPSYRVAWQDVLDFAPEIIVLTCCGF